MWNFKGTLWNSTQNILPIHWKISFLYNTDILRALKFKSSYVFLKRPPGNTLRQLIITHDDKNTWGNFSDHFDMLMQEIRNSNRLAMELCLSYINPPICNFYDLFVVLKFTSKWYRFILEKYILHMPCQHNCHWWIPHHKQPVTWNFVVFYVLSLNKLLTKQSSCRGSEMHWSSCDVTVMSNEFNMGWTYWFMVIEWCKKLLWFFLSQTTCQIESYKTTTFHVKERQFA